MTLREVQAKGHEALVIASRLLQRARLADPEFGVFEAADLQWWWRAPRVSDQVEKLFWFDQDGPVAGVLLTSWTNKDWQCDPVLIPGVTSPDAEELWNRAIELASRVSPSGFTIPISSTDELLQTLASTASFASDHQDFTGWMTRHECPQPIAPPSGFIVADRTQRPTTSHPLEKRNGVDVDRRLKECPLYNPELDISIETSEGTVAGESLYWFDPITRVGLVEPVRVEDDFQRRGLARTMLSVGINKLFSLGAERVKVSWESEIAGALYQGVGFRQTSTTTWFHSPR